MKKVIDLITPGGRHWVGDGFPVRSLFNYGDHARALSPFLLLDHAGPASFEPSTRPRGVAQHPHRGFETVTIVHAGEVAHRDSAGHGGEIGPGDVQWMTAGAGILHEEYHGEGFTRTGGTLEMTQLWVNLPARHKMAPPGYQGIRAEQIPTLELAGAAGTLRVIAGACDGHSGPARTFTPMNVWDVRLAARSETSFTLPDGWGGAVVVLAGDAVVNGSTHITTDQVAILERPGTQITLAAAEETRLLVLSGEPIDEPVVGHGPFVMNTQAEIMQAVRDFRDGAFAT